MLVTKPGYERTVTHTHTVPDECTIFDFKTDFYSNLLAHYGNLKFFTDNDLHSTLLKTDPELEFIHFYILHLVVTRSGSKLEIDNLVMEILEKTLTCLGPYQADPRINGRIKRNHLYTIEKAKAYITQNFTNDISLMEIAEHCHVSPFHFSRIFKMFTDCSPHQFLLTVRLKQAEILIRNTSMTVMEVAFSSGFNSIEYFTAAFKNKYKCPPARFRSERAFSG
jgi:AraC-like DNA-binding protein